jgi:hypothetical protein
MLNERLQGFDFVIENRNADPADTNETANAVRAQDRGTCVRSGRNLREQIAWEERRVKQLLPITPLMFGRPKWKKNPDSVLLKFKGDFFFVSGPSLDRKPRQFGRPCSFAC